MALRAGFHGTVGQPSAQVIDGSLNFDSSATNYLKKIPDVAGNRRTFTISFWVKRGEGTSNEPGILSTYDGVSGPAFTCYFNSVDKLRIYDDNSGYNLNLLTTQVFRDYNSWYHIVISIDTTASDKAKLYVNGVRVTEFGTEVYPTDNETNFDWNTATAHNIGRHVNAYDGNISNFYSIDGQTLGPEYFGFTDPLTNTWRPKKFKGPTSPNDGTTWSQYLTMAAGDTIQTPEYAFDNDSYGTYAERSAGSNNPSIYTFTPPSTIKANSSVRVSAYAASGSTLNHIKVTYNNGVQVTKTAGDLGLGNPGDQVWFDLSSYINFPSDISSIEYSSDGGGGRLAAIEIDGILLIDGLNDPKGFGTNGFYLPFDGNSPISRDKSSRGNDWTPVNFGGSNTIEKATGALPILNTTNGGNTATVGVRTDAYASNLVLALPLVGIRSDFSNRINSGTTEKAITVNGNAVADSVQSNFYGGSFVFDGTGDSLETPPSSDFNFGSGDYTVEWWMYWTTKTGYQAVFDVGYTDADSFLIQSNTGTSRFIVYAEGGNILEELPAVGDAPLNKWIHYAVVRNGDSMTLYRNGVVSDTGSATAGSVTGTSHGSSTHTVYVGGDEQGYEFNGYLQDFRVYKGVAKYTEEFIPASTNPDILPDTPSGVSGSSELDKITDGAVYFDGSDYLTVPGSSDFVLDGDFTIECFVYFISGSVMVDFARSGSYANAWQIYNQSPTFYGYSSGSGGNAFMTSDTPLSKGWNHLVVTRTISNNTARMFINGVQTASSTDFDETYGNDASNVLMVGAQNASGPTAYFTGYISNLRIIKGTALYTSNFTPPTKPLTNVTNTTLLCCQSTTDVTEGAVKPADVSWVPTGYTYWSGMNENWDVSGTTTSDISATGDGDWIATYLPSSGKYYFETIVNNPGQYRVIGLAIGQSGAGANYLDNMFGYYFNGTGSPPLFLTKNSSGTNRSSEAQGSGFYHGETTPTTFHDGDILMWGWDADNDKIYFGLNGTWYNNGDPVAGTGHIVSGEDLSASSFYLKVGYMNSGGHSLNKLSLTNVPSSESGSSSSIVSSREIFNFNLVNKASNFNPFNTDINTVRGQETNYCTLNPLLKKGGAPLTLSNGSLDVDTPSSNAHGHCGSTFSVSSGKWYFEVTKTSSTVARGDGFGVAQTKLVPNPANDWLDFGVGKNYIYPQDNGIYMADGATDVLIPLATSEANDPGVYMFAYDFDAGKGWVGKDGVWYSWNSLTGGNPTDGINPVFDDFEIGEYYTPVVTHYTAGNPYSFNFGQKPFKYAPPDGYQPLNSANIRPETIVARPDQYVGVTTYTGNAPIGSTNTQSFNIGFKPDLVWIKSRDASRNHRLTDTVRDAGKELYSDLSNAEGTVTDGVTSFTDNGFVVGANNNYNYTEGYVAWCWKAGGNSNTYNVDNVGYSTSTDINMSVGALTSVSYDQSQTWSNLDTYPTSYSPTTPANLFNGVVSTGDADFWYSAGASTVRFDNLVDQLPEIVNTIELYVYDRNGTMIVTVNGVGANNYANTGTYKWIKLTPNQKIVTLTVSGTDSTYWGIGAIKINGVMLANAGVTPANVPSIAPTGCSVGTKQGFSIVAYEGTSVNNSTIPHGLTKKPQFILAKNRDSGFYWHVYHAGMGYTKYAEIINSSTFADNAAYWTAEPTDNVFTIGIANALNADQDSIIAYLWHDVPGLQKFGIYEGNADSGGHGPYVELGFKPAILMLKNADDTEHWYIYDSERSSHNPSYQSLMMSSNASEETGNTNTRIDILSSGFKLRQSNGPNNANTYIYAAWAEAPSVNLYGGASNAR